MPARVFEDVLQTDLAVVEPVPFSLDGPLDPCYPLPRLRLVGSGRAGLDVVTLQNESLSVTVCPRLGGRVIAFSSKRSGEVLRVPAAIVPIEDGPRGLFLSHGLVVSEDAFLDSMTSRDYLLHEPDHDDGAAAVMLFSATPGSRVALQVVFSLLPADEELRVEVRAFNRTLETQPLHIVAAFGGMWECEHYCDNDIVPRGFIAPRDSVAFTFTVRAEGLKIPTTTCGCEKDAFTDASAPAESLPIHLRGAAHIRDALAATKEGDLRSALDYVDRALATLGDDPLAWWHRAVLLRLLGEDDDGASISMAHALSPLEPALRADAFLAMPQSHGREPNPILKPLAADPDALLECVHLLIEADLVQEASRLIDEALRHRDVPMLRYMHAWCLQTYTNMKVEAANEVRLAGALPPAPPFPWRSLEVRAVTELAATFKDDANLQTLARLLEKRNGPAT